MPVAAPAGEQGFTLAEMLAALGILLFGVTALLGAMSSSVGQRRTTDARHALAAMCELAMHRVQFEAVRSTTDDSTPFDLEFVALTDQPVPGFPGMTWSASAREDESRPQLWLVTISATWLEEGEEVGAEFHRIVPKQLPLRDRVLSFRDPSAGPPRLGRVEPWHQRELEVMPMLRSFVLFAAAALPLATVTSQSVQLADGRVMLVDVESCDGEGMRVKRLDNGGMLDLRWDHLSASSATFWKRKNDLLADEQDELLVRVTEVVFDNNGVRKTLVGNIVSNSGDSIVVSSKGVEYPIPKRNLIETNKVERAAIDVFTQEEFYTNQLAQRAPGNSADKHMLLAEDLIKFRDYERAAKHVDKAKELDNSKDKAYLAELDDRLKRFKAAAKELGIIEQIQIARSRARLKDLKKGVELIEKFEADYPDSKLKAEFESEKERFRQARERVLTGKVSEQWRRLIRTVVEKKVGEKGVTLQAARDFAENQMTDQIVERLVKQFEIEPDEVRSLWTGREKFRLGKRTEHFSYGVGSWVLGEKEILKDTAVEKAKAKMAENEEPQSKQDRNLERFAKLLRQAKERRAAANGGGSGQQREKTEEDWWKEANRAEKISWLRAYYAEYGGQLKVKFASVQQCISCYGQGDTPDFDENGKVIRVKCFLCQGTKFLRSFKAY